MDPGYDLTDLSPKRRERLRRRAAETRVSAAEYHHAIRLAMRVTAEKLAAGSQSADLGTAALRSWQEALADERRWAASQAGWIGRVGYWAFRLFR